MSIITTGINIVATGVNQSINQIQRFGQALNNTHRQAQSFANGYNNMGNQVSRSSNTLSRALSQNWNGMYQSAKRSVKNQERELRRLSSMYDRTFREIGNRYQSMVMGSVALSMSGIGLSNMGGNTLGALKSSLDVARDFETVMAQVQFYGQKTAGEMKTIQKDIFDIAYRMPQTASEIASAFLQAQKTGYGYDASKVMAEEASKISFMSMGKLDGEESLKYISQMKKFTNAYATEAERLELVQKGIVDSLSVGQLTDKLTMTADVSAASIDSLWKTMQSSRSAFDNMGTDIDSMLAIAGVMSDRLQPRAAGQALSSFGRGINMAEKAKAEGRGTRGEYYSQLTNAMGGGVESFRNADGNVDILKYIEGVATKSKEIWGEGVDRTSKLISIFGGSAIDLFHAYDNYAMSGNVSMEEMRDKIKDADKHSEKFMETIMNTSYGTEMKLKAVAEQFQILFGGAIRPLFNDILDGLTFIIGKVNQFIQAHPKLTKVLGYGAGLAGMLLVATGAIMLAVGGFLALYASIGNVITQIARNTRVLDMLSQGYGSAGAMLKGKFLGPLRMLGIQLLKISGITFFLWLAWKNDFLRMRTTFESWKKSISKGLTESQSMFELYGKGSVTALNQAFLQNQREGGLENWIANTWTKASMLWDGIKDIWSDGTISAEKYQMLSDAGLLGTVEKVYEIKTAVTDFWNGFKEGMKDGIDLLKTILGPLLDVWDWISDKILKIFQHFGYFENVNKGIGSQWEQWGQKLGYIVGSVVAIRVGLWGWLKAIKLVISPFKLMWKLTKGIFNMFSKLKNFKLANMLGNVAKLMIPKPLRQMVNTGRYATSRRFSGNARQGAHSRLPYARQTVDPTTGRPTGQVTYQRKWWQRNNRGPTVVPSRDGRSNSTLRSRGIFGRARDMWQGRAYAPETRTDRRGRTYHQIRTRQGGVMRTTADGRVNGRQVRTGGVQGYLFGQGRQRRRNVRSAINQVNFQDAGMNYGDSVGQRGHRRRSIKAGVKGWWNRQQRLGIQSGGGFNSRVQAQMGGGQGGSSGGSSGGAKGGARGGGKFNAANLFKGAGKGMGNVASGLGKGLMKGLGGVVKKGLPLLFKGALHAIPFVGWALMAWEAISLIWSNWDAIKNGAGIAWEWIKGKAVQVWDWVKVKAEGIWQGILGVATGIWNWIQGVASNVWNAILGFASNVWQGIVGIATGVWNWISGVASGVWNAILGFATAVWNGITTIASTVWESVKGFASAMWDAMKGFAQTAWDSVTGIASTVIDTVKGYVNSIFDGLLSSAQTAWNGVKKFFADNPITQAVKVVGEAVSGDGKKGGKKGGKSARTGEWYVPKDNMPYNLHQGEMVLKRNEAQILRSMVGTDSNSISKFLLDREDVANGNIQVAPPQKKILRPKVNVADQPQTQPTEGKGDTTIEVTFAQGAIVVANASASEMKKGAKQMFEEFKRMVELDNMKHYKPARPRR